MIYLKRLGELGLRKMLMIGIALFCAGCTHTRDIGSVESAAIAYNMSVERSQNSVMFLNVVRASLYRPMHFTSIEKLSRSTEKSAELGFTLPFGGAPTDDYDLTPKVKAVIKPSFDVAVHNSDEFYTGVLSPLTPTQLANFVGIGFPIDLVILLTSQQFVVEQGGTRTVYENKASQFDTIQPIIGAIQREWFTREIDGSSIVIHDGDVSIRISPRSAEGIVYFLGQIMRSNNNITLGGQHVFPGSELSSLSPDEGWVLTVEYEDKIYGIPRGGEYERAMVPLNLASYAIGLNKKATSLPTLDVRQR